MMTHDLMEEIHYCNMALDGAIRYRAHLETDKSEDVRMLYFSMKNSLENYKAFEKRLHQQHPGLTKPEVESPGLARLAKALVEWEGGE
jgi:hypothetical protein